ncbi:helix-turn-helix transcriptional regulator [Devosia sediminis]|uniref:helix-turn-helix transcriptional regulator n=1 Tax=Devosia sediminis TaxID=2798801 RepID=UPI0018E9894C|nr:helix-turn-helix transcriptional regulator [Devosia sediminis]
MDAIYEAAAVPDLWPAVLTRFAGTAGAHGAVLMALQGQTLRWRASPSFQDHAEQYLAAGHNQADQRTIRLVAANQPGFVRDLDVFSAEEWENDPIRSNFWVPRGLGWGVASHIYTPSGDVMIFHAERRLADGPGDADLVARLNLLRPHLARAAFLSNRIAFERIRTAIDTLTAVGLAAVALTPSGRVLLANDAFAEASHIWTTRGQEQVSLYDRKADSMLKERLAVIDQQVGPMSVPVRDEDGSIVAVIHLVPIRGSARDLFGQTSAIAVLSEPGAGIPNAALIGSLFDLTPAEITVAQAVATGEAPAEIAQRLGRSIATVRNQIKSAMEKTGCSRQVELTLLMRQFLVS